MAKTRVSLRDEDSAQQQREQNLNLALAELGLSVRTLNALESKGVFTVRDALNCRRSELLAITNFGEKSLEELLAALKPLGFERKSE